MFSDQKNKQGCSTTKVEIFKVPFCWHTVQFSSVQFNEKIELFCLKLQNFSTRDHFQSMSVATGMSYNVSVMAAFALANF